MNSLHRVSQDLADAVEKVISPEAWWRLGQIIALSGVTAPTGSADLATLNLGPIGVTHANARGGGPSTGTRRGRRKDP